MGTQIQLELNHQYETLWLSAASTTSIGGRNVWNGN